MAKPSRIVADTVDLHAPCWGCGHQFGPCPEDCPKQEWPVAAELGRD